MRDIWRDQAIEELQLYNAKKQALVNIPQQIAELESSIASVRSPSADIVSVRGGGGKRDDAYLNNIVKRDSLKTSLEAAQRAVDRIESALLTVTEDERKMLERFYIIPERGAAKRLAMDMGIDEQTVYRRKDDALYKFKTAMYG